jgi:cell division septation protein DedD
MKSCHILPMHPYKTIQSFCAQAMLVFAFYATAAYAGATAGDARALLQKGDYRDARALLEKAHAENPSDPEITLLYATTLSDANTALALYKKISQDKSLPDSLRSEAYFRLGCVNYLWGRHHKASGYFINAAGTSGKSRDVEACYLAAVHDTIDSSFVATLRKVAEDTALAAGKTANFYLGIFYYANRNYRRALLHFTASVTPSRACAAQAGAYTCAAILSRREQADSVLELIKQACPEYLEKGVVEKTAAKPLTAAKKDTTVKKDTTSWLPPDSSAAKKQPVKKTEPAGRKAAFSLQVGAFSTMENAEAFKAGLSKELPHASIVSGAAGDKTVYRVRVGSFDTKENAQAFGDSSLLKKGLQFRVIDEAGQEIKDKTIIK